MTGRNWLVSGIALLSLLWTGLVAAAPAGQVQSAAGDVRVISSSAAPKYAKSGDVIEQGTQVQTGDRSRVVLRFADGQVVALSSNSSFRLDAYRFEQNAPEKGEFAASFLRGAARFVTGLIGDRNRKGWRLDTPTATAGIRGTDFLLGIKESLYATVKKGSTSLTNSAGTAVVEEGGSAIVANARTLPALISADAVPAGLFTEIESVSLGALGGSASGSVNTASIGTVPVVNAVAVGLGLGVAAIAASGGGETSVTNHH
jgi:hypothetical protein